MVHDESFEQFLKDAVEKADGKSLFEVLRDYHKIRLEASIGDQSAAMSAKLDAVDEFLVHARDYLTRNPVVSTFTVETGLGVRLQRKHALPIIPSPERKPVNFGAAAITNPGVTPGMEIIREPAYPITGKE